MQMTNKLYITFLAGFGDCLSLICLLPSIRKTYPNHEIVFYIGGFGRSPILCKEQLEAEKYADASGMWKTNEVKIINNLTYHSQLPQIKEFLRKSVLKEGDLLLDASFCEEIFNNQEPWFWQHEMKWPYNYANLELGQYSSETVNKTDEIDIIFEATHKNNKTVNDVLSKERLKIIGIKPLTKSGNAEGFEADLANNRFWPKEKWHTLVQRIIDAGHIPAILGISDEDWELYEKFKDHCVDFRNKSVGEVQCFIKHLDAMICTNSWEWEVTSRHKRKIPTYCFFLKNPFFIENHVPRNQEFYDTCYVETDSNVTVDQVFETVEYMIKHKKRPEVNYSVAMITYKDDDTIEKTMENIVSNIGDNHLCVVHGTEEPNHTFNIINEMLPKNGKIMVAPWEHDFSQQKNYALSLCKSGWRILLDADETLDSYTWGMLPWLMWRAEKQKIDCISLSRINVLEGMNKEQLQEYAQKQGWQLNGYFGNWINFPDFQKRIFYQNPVFSKLKIKYVGQTHEQIVGFEKETALLNHPIHHHKSKERQEIGLKREHDQYRMKAEKVYRDVYDNCL